MKRSDYLYLIAIANNGNLLGKFSPLIVKIAKRITTDSIDSPTLV
jgi:hypothetical protein